MTDSLIDAGLEIAGGTSLFRLVRTPAAAALADHLGRAGIVVRRFAEAPASLRFGLPADEAAWQRLTAALDAFAVSTKSVMAGLGPATPTLRHGRATLSGSLGQARR